jgi:hypothetical protein
VWAFRSKIEGAIKDKILTKLTKKLYSKLEYNQGDKYAFGDIVTLLQAGFLHGYDHIDKIEDSIGFTIDEPHKHIIIQGYELETSKTSRDSKGRRRKTITNHCYLLRVKFPEARIELKNDLLITTDEADNLSRSGRYGIIGVVIGASIGIIAGLTLGTIAMLGLIGGALTFGIRRWYIQKKRVQLENIEFEKFFDVKCEDPIGSRMIITPAFMDRLVKLAKSSRYHYELLYRADRFYIKWSLSGSYLEINTWRNIRENMETFVAWYAQMKEIIGFVFDMRLMYYAHFQSDETQPDVIPEFENMKPDMADDIITSINP